MIESAGILVYRNINNEPEFLLLCPGGPFYKNQDATVWTIPKGIINPNEQVAEAAIREFQEETGFEIVQEPEFLMQLKLSKKKLLHVFFTKSDYSLDQLKSNMFELEYPKGSGQIREFPEIAKGRWMKYDEALKYIHPKQSQIVEKLNNLVNQAFNPM